MKQRTARHRLRHRCGVSMALHSAARANIARLFADMAEATRAVNESMAALRRDIAQIENR